MAREGSLVVTTRTREAPGIARKTVDLPHTVEDTKGRTQAPSAAKRSEGPAVWTD